MNATPSVLSRTADEALHGVEIPRGGKEGMSPQQQLWQAVVALAWQDAFVHSDWVLCNGKARGAEERAERGNRARATARRWLMVTWGALCEDRQIVCDLAGIDEPLLRKISIAKWTQVKQQKQREKPEEPAVDHKALATAARVNLDRAFQQLLQRTGDIDESDVDEILRELAEDETEQMLVSTA
ncbi:MAG: hypothetical protein GEU87_02495 [Alphaproteobacteria bacterium]|nr:hypothetical protein [Alphaproteobacteria bacterium]